MNRGLRVLVYSVLIGTVLGIGAARIAGRERAPASAPLSSAVANGVTNAIAADEPDRGASSLPSFLLSASDSLANVSALREARSRPIDVPHGPRKPQVEATPVAAKPASAACPEQERAAEATEPIVIGAILPLSSPGAFEAGFTMQFALNTAAKIANLHGGVAGRPVRLVTYDSAGIPRRGALYAERLIKLDCARVIVGLYHDNVATTVVEVAEAHQVPVIIAGARAPELTAFRSPYIFRTVPTLAMMDENLVDFLAHQFAAVPARYWRDSEALVMVVTEDLAEARARAEAMLANFHDAGIDAKHVTLDLASANFGPTLTRILASEMLPDAVVLGLPSDAAADFQLQLLDAGIGPSTGTLIVTYPAGNGEATPPILLEGDTALVGQDGPWPTTVGAVGAPLLADFQGYFGHWPDSLAFAAYDSLLLAVEALTQSQGAGGLELVEALEATDLMLGAGRYRFPYGLQQDPSDAGVADFYWHQRVDAPLFFLHHGHGTHADDLVIWPPLSE